MVHGSSGIGGSWSVGWGVVAVGGPLESARGEELGELREPGLRDAVECGEAGGDVSGGGLKNCNGGSSGSIAPGVEKVVIVGAGRMALGGSSGSSSIGVAVLTRSEVKLEEYE